MLGPIHKVDFCKLKKKKSESKERHAVSWIEKPTEIKVTVMNTTLLQRMNCHRTRKYSVH